VQRASRSPKVRPPAVAGQFYPADPLRLRATVTELLAAVPRRAEAAPKSGPKSGPESASKSAPKSAPKALIAPHAGYIYSGAVAAAAFATLRERGEAIRRVVLIGPAHYLPVHGIAVPSADAFATPLGRVPVDRAALATIAELPFVVTADTPHTPEHALEVELPFLQEMLGEFAVVPLLAGGCPPAQVAEVLGRLWGEGDTLLVVSSDLSHYHDYATARRLDAATAAAIERGDWASLGAGQACGHLSVAGLLVEAQRRGLKPQRLALCNSGDTAGSRDRVVGYGAWMF
jgi:MEMO1 family protein